MSKPIIPARGVEYYPETKDLLLLRCPKCGKENYALNVTKGICTWCGYDAHELIKENGHE
jgi:ribosomal protein L37E